MRAVNSLCSSQRSRVLRLVAAANTMRATDSTGACGYAGREDAFAEATHRAQQAGIVSAQHSARVLARSLHTTISGLRVMAKAGASQESLEDVARLCLTLF